MGSLDGEKSPPYERNRTLAETAGKENKPNNNESI